jgi:aconitate hydratase
MTEAPEMSTGTGHDSFKAKTTLKVGDVELTYYRLARLAEVGVAEVSRLPFSIRVLLESVLRGEDGYQITANDVIQLAKYDPKSPPQIEVPFKPARVLLQDFTGVPAVVDLAAMRSAVDRLGGDPKRINPQIPVDLVIDHSVQIDYFASTEALALNAELEFSRNRERYEFLHWGQKAFDNFRAVPPSSGICHQVNLEYLAKVVQKRELDGELVAFPDSLVGTDSHTPMVNGVGVLGWGVGGIEAEAAMLGQPLYMLPPAVVGVRLEGSLPEGATATDLVLHVTEMLRAKGVVGKFVEFFGPGLASMAVPDRATISNMAPEYGATMGFFPVDQMTLNYLRATGRGEDQVALVEAYCKAQGLFRTDETPDPEFQEVVELDLGSIEPAIAGPKRPQDRIALSDAKAAWQAGLRASAKERGFELDEKAITRNATITLEGQEIELTHGDVAIAAITSCTNTSNPSVMIGAGLLAKKAVEAGLRRKPWVKTSLAPGSKVVTDYLEKAGLIPYFEQLGFHVVGYGCTTCIGNSGPLPPTVAKGIEEAKLVVAGVLSGNRNFEGRIHPQVRANYLASPLLVVSYALAGTVDIDITKDPIGMNDKGQPVYLKEIWPSAAEIQEAVAGSVDPEFYRREYDGIEGSNETWNQIPSTESVVYPWNESSTYIQEPPFFVGMSKEAAPIGPIDEARVLVLVGDSVTTDHISPAGAFSPEAPAGKYLIEQGVEVKDFNSYGSRRGNDRVMTRGTFANIRLRNRMAPDTEGGFTTHVPSGEVTTIYEASLRYKNAGTPTIVLAGKDYGMGSSRDWAAKGTLLLGIKAVIAESFERIHRSNLVGMGVLPLQFKQGESVATCGLTGGESFSITVDNQLEPGQEVTVTATDDKGGKTTFTTTCRIDTPIEVDYYRHGGILSYVLRNLA